MPTRPRRAAWRAFSAPATRRERSSCRPRASTPTFLTPSICASPRRRCSVRLLPPMLDQLLAGYEAPEGRFDELLAAPGRPRPHWDAFLRALAERSEREVSDTLSLTERQIREHGITYNVYADAQGVHRPWEVDPIPLVLPADEW